FLDMFVLPWMVTQENARDVRRNLAGGVQPVPWPPSQHGPERELLLCDGFDDGRFLAPLGFLDRKEPPGFGVSSHLKGLGLWLVCLGFFPFRHVRSPPKRIYDADGSRRTFSAGSCGNLSKKDASSPGVCPACRGHMRASERPGWPPYF